MLTHQKRCKQLICFGGSSIIGCLQNIATEQRLKRERDFERHKDKKHSGAVQCLAGYYHIKCGHMLGNNYWWGVKLIPATAEMRTRHKDKKHSGEKQKGLRGNKERPIYKTWGSCIKVDEMIGVSKLIRDALRKQMRYVREAPMKMLLPLFLFGRTIRNDQYKTWDCIKVDEMKAVSKQIVINPKHLKIQYEARGGELPSGRLGKVLKAEFSDWCPSHSSY